MLTATLPSVLFQDRGDPGARRGAGVKAANPEVSRNKTGADVWRRVCFSMTMARAVLKSRWILPSYDSKVLLERQAPATWLGTSSTELLLLTLQSTPSTASNRHATCDNGHKVLCPLSRRDARLCGKAVGSRWASSLYTMLGLGGSLAR